MAGSPKKRERQARAAAAAVQATGIDPDELRSPSNVHTLSPVLDAQRIGAPQTAATRTGAPTRARTRATPALSPGKLQTGAVDELAFQQMQAFADALAPECTVRIERLRPTFAAGVCEDFLLDAGELSELIEHVRDEYGGQRYKLTLLSSNGTALQSTKLNVPGAPKHEGRKVTRSFWTGDDEPRAHASAPQQNPTDQFASIAGVLETLVRIVGPRDNGTEMIAAVREISAHSTEQTHRLIRALVANPSAAPKTLQQQMAEVIETQRAFGQLREAIIDAEPPASNTPAPPNEESMVAGAIKQILVQGWQNSAAARGAVVASPAPQPQQAPQSQQPSPPQQPTNVRRVVGLRRAE